MNRKDDHIEGALAQRPKTNDFDQVRFVHDALAGGRVTDVTLASSMAGRAFETPIYINAMTGGSAHAEQVNRRLAMLARHFSLPMAVGSLKSAVKDPQWRQSFTVVREVYPEGVILANIGADNDVETARKAIDLLGADILQVHLNPLQELIMPEGDRDFTDVLPTLKAYRDALAIPIMVKEVGFGLSGETLGKLSEAGIGIVDVSGRGGTNFAGIENARRDQSVPYLDDWGLSTVECLLDAARFDHLEIHASGGIRHPLDAIKAIRLGASMVGMSGYFLRLVETHTHEEAVAGFGAFIDGLKRVMALLGAKDLHALRNKPLVLSPALDHYRRQRS